MAKRKVKVQGVWNLFKQVPRAERKEFVEALRRAFRECDDPTEWSDPVPELPPGISTCPMCGAELTDLGLIGADAPLKLLDCVACDRTFAQPLQ